MCFNSKAIVFYPESYYSCPRSSTNSKSRLFPRAGAFLFLFSGDLSSGYMDDIKQETANGPTYPLPPSRPINNMTATCNRLSTSTSGPRPGCQPSPPRILKLNNLDSQDSRGRNRNSHNAAMVTGHVPVIHPGRNLYPENLVPSFPRAPSGRYGVSGRNEGGRNSRVTSTTANYRNRTAKAKPPKQQGAGDAEEEEEEE